MFVGAVLGCFIGLKLTTLLDPVYVMAKQKLLYSNAAIVSPIMLNSCGGVTGPCVNQHSKRYLFQRTHSKKIKSKGTPSLIIDVILSYNGMTMSVSKGELSRAAIERIRSSKRKLRDR